MKRGREEWAALVDAVGNDTSTEPVRVSRDAPYDRSAILPMPVTEAMTAYLSHSAQETHPLLTEQIQPRITFEEGMHAKPVEVNLTDTFAGTDQVLKQRRAAELKGVFARIMANQGVFAVRSEDLPFGSDDRLAAGFFRAGRFQSRYKKPDFLPIILVPSAPSAPIQLVNARMFFQEGKFVDPYSARSMLTPQEEESSATSSSVQVVPMSYDKAKYRVQFDTFLVMDDPRKVTNWDHVCACLVQDNDWQFERWFPKDPAKRVPSLLFSQVRGFLPYFEEDKIPSKVTEWNVKPLILTRKLIKETSHVAQVFTFWEELFTFINTNPRFSKYTLSE